MNVEKNLKLQNEGYYTELLTLDEQLILKKIVENNKFEVESACHTGYKNDWTHNSNYDELSQFKIEALESAWQFWYFKASPKLNEDDFKFIQSIGKRIVKELYPAEVIEEYNDITQLNYTLFNYGCFIKNHSDGYNKNSLCNILFYLNEEYKDGCGGELVINNEHTIKPEFGRIGLIDFHYSNPEHKVNKIESTTFQRKAFLASIPIKVIN